MVDNDCSDYQRDREAFDGGITLSIARKGAARVAELARDSERAHAHEDRLRAAVLAAVAAGHPDARELAAVALETSTISFHRWCA